MQSTKVKVVLESVNFSAHNLHLLDSIRQINSKNIPQNYRHGVGCLPSEEGQYDALALQDFQGSFDLPSKARARLRRPRFSYGSTGVPRYDGNGYCN